MLQRGVVHDQRWYLSVGKVRQARDASVLQSNLRCSLQSCQYLLWNVRILARDPGGKGMGLGQRSQQASQDPPGTSEDPLRTSVSS